MRGSIIKRGNKYLIVVNIYNEQNVKKRKFISGYDKKRCRRIRTASFEGVHERVQM